MNLIAPWPATDPAPAPAISPIYGNWLKEAWLTVCSFEFLFVLFLFAGRFKADPKFAWIPVDLTGLLLALSGLVGAAEIWRRGYVFPRNSLKFLLAAAAFFGFVLLSKAWSPSLAYGKAKSLQIGVLTVYTTFACTCILATSPERIRRFALALTLFSVWLSIEWIAAWLSPPELASAYKVGGGYQGMGRVAGLALIACWALALKPRSVVPAWGCGIVAALSALVLTLAGARMPMFAALIGAVVVCGLAWRAGLLRGGDGKNNRLAMAGLAGATLLGGLLSVPLSALPTGPVSPAKPSAIVDPVGSASSMTPDGTAAAQKKTPVRRPTTLERVQVMFHKKYGVSTTARTGMWAASWSFWRQRPLVGHGLGAFPVLHLGKDVRGYPHNLLLETLVESGLIGLALLLVLFGMSLTKLRARLRSSSDPMKIFVAGAFLYLLCNAMISGDMPSNGLLFGVMGMMPGASRKSG